MTASHSTPTPLRPALVVAAIGVVFGDIGTSPLYTMKEVFSERYGLQLNHANVLGVLSLIVLALVIVVTLKYVMIIMRADNRGEGGVIALMAIAQRAFPADKRARWIIAMLGVFGTALFLGDCVITPAISVLSAVEGLQQAAPSLARFVVPIAIGVLVGLFAIQRRGAAAVGSLFGPVMVLWFGVLALLGLLQIIGHPEILYALNPYYAFSFIYHHPLAGFLSLGAIVLAVTGGEALYADMGHFGKRPIMFGWYCYVFPALVINYFGQGAHLLGNRNDGHNPFYSIVPDGFLLPMVGLATLATVIASQAVISGAFSLCRQAMQIGFLPRMKVHHTSSEAIGQVYLPWVNRFLLLTVVMLVWSFQTSSNLAAAYGISVTGTMLIDTVLVIIVATRIWGWRWPVVAVPAAVFLLTDLAFFSANAVKVLDGGWFPLALAIVLFTLMTTWRRGRSLLHQQIYSGGLKLEDFVDSIALSMPTRVSGTAVFMTASSHDVPNALLHNLKHNKVLHERNVILTVVSSDSPTLKAFERAQLSPMPHGFFRLTLMFGYQEDQDVPRALERCGALGCVFDLQDTTFFLSRETVIPRADRGMPIWRDKIFAFMARNSISAVQFFNLPTNRVVELGAQVEI